MNSQTEIIVELSAEILKLRADNEDLRMDLSRRFEEIEALKNVRLENNKIIFDLRKDNEQSKLTRKELKDALTRSEDSREQLKVEIDQLKLERDELKQKIAELEETKNGNKEDK